MAARDIEASSNAELDGDLQEQARQHGARAADEYRSLRPLYSGFARALASLLRRGLRGAGLAVHRVESRAKSVDSLADKACRLIDAEDGRSGLRYAYPLREINDLAGVRIVTYFKADLPAVREVVQAELAMVEPWQRVDKAIGLGYESWHSVVRLPIARLHMEEYSRFEHLVCEVQLRTLLQHAWAEIEHGARYKRGLPASPEIDRIFVRAKVMLDQADDHFDQIRHAQRAARLRKETEVRLEAASLRSLIDEVSPPYDGSISDTGYELFLERLHRLGVTTVEGLRGLLRGYRQEEITEALAYPFDARQYRRFEDLLLAATGDTYVRQFLYASGTDRFDRLVQRRDRLKERGIEPARPSAEADPDL